MKKIVINIRNRVFSEGVSLALKQTGNFNPFYVSSLSVEDVLIECVSLKPDIILMDVTPVSEELSLGKRLKIITEINKHIPRCKCVLLCDEIAYPELAKEVMRSKQVGQIDAFFYASVTTGYLAAALDSL